MDNNTQLKQLLTRLENLQQKLHYFEAEIKAVRLEISRMQAPDEPEAPVISPQLIVPADEEKAPPAPTSIPVFTAPELAIKNISTKPDQKRIVKSDFEKFIGENLISKIGILILIIGVVIGGKYAIDHDMVSPVTRIVLGYLLGISLMVFAIKLKAKYENFSAVLLSGSIAVLYFITFIAYSLYALLPQALAFGLMVLFTSFTIIAAIKYNRQVIAHIGLVGAYAIPFLLSNGSGQVAVLFSYIAIINTGILFISFKRYWKPLFFSAFGFTWIIYITWHITAYDPEKHFLLAIVFAGLFFLIFYLANLAYKLVKKEPFHFSDTLLLLANSFIYYGMGYLSILNVKDGHLFLGLFTLLNAIVHFSFSLIVYKRNLADKNLLYLILALVISFVTIAIPVQLNGNWVTLLWLAEATVLFYLGKAKKIGIYERIAFPVIFLAFFSLLHDWMTGPKTYLYGATRYELIPFFNVGFLTGCLFITGLGLIQKFNQVVTPESEKRELESYLLRYAVPSILVFVCYYTFKLEISHIFTRLYHTTRIDIMPRIQDESNYDKYRYNGDIMYFRTVVIYIYSLLFISILNLVIIRKIKNPSMFIAALVLSGITLIAFLTHGLYTLSELRESYIAQDNPYFTSTAMNICIRYISIIFFAGFLFILKKLCTSGITKNNYNMLFDYTLYISFLWLLSNELINILQLIRHANTYKLNLSILWGIYSVFLIIIGIWKNKKYLRLLAIGLFAITLIKLFFYDIVYLSTIAKTIVFVALGVLLLIISFLYNKYKHLIIDNAEEKESVY